MPNSKNGVWKWLASILAALLVGGVGGNVMQAIAAPGFNDIKESITLHAERPHQGSISRDEYVRLVNSMDRLADKVIELTSAVGRLEGRLGGKQ